MGDPFYESPFRARSPGRPVPVGSGGTIYRKLLHTRFVRPSPRLPRGSERPAAAAAAAAAAPAASAASASAACAARPSRA
eukprot:scaffold3341_cov317-Prasinococcus_capsulatus_cf.AAC.4